MQSGKRPPFISEQAVRSALEALLYSSSSPETTALESLLLIDEILANPDLPMSEQSRSFAVQFLLSSMIDEQYQSHRRVFELPQLAGSETRSAAEADIDRVAQSGTPELIGWGWLYYHYARVDLGIGLETFAEHSHIDVRTVRRYQNHVIERLTKTLVSEEWSARERQRKRRLYAAIPGPITALIGREQLIENWLDSAAFPCHVQITGPPGIGKTAFVQALLHRRIDAEQIDQIVWIDEPDSADFVRQRLSESLIPEGSTIACREYMMMMRVVVVLDGCERLQSDMRALEELLGYLNLAEVLLTSSVYESVAGVTHHIALNELDGDSANQLMRITLASEVPEKREISDEERAYIWETVGGNPLLIKLASRSLAFGLHEMIGSLEQIYNRVYSDLARSAQTAWCILALFPPGRVSLRDVPQQWQSEFTPMQLETLRRHHLFQDAGRDVTAVHLSTSARQFILRKTESDESVNCTLETLLDQFDSFINDVSTSVLALGETILYSGLPEIDHARYDRWVKVLCYRGINAGHYSQWRAILERYFRFEQVVDFKLQIAYGISLRRLSEWSQARSVFEQVVAQAGQTGAFLDQARACLELGMLYRYRGMYDRTSKLLKRVEKIIARQPDEELRQLLLVEQAQIAVDQGDGASAKSYLAKLGHKTGRMLSLDSEAALLTGDFRRCNILARSALKAFEGDKAASARVHTIVGRSYEIQNDLENAHHALANALTLLETTNDLFGLERAQLNLGALLLRMGSYDDAFDLLKQAETIQRQLGDRTALAATRHNLSLLKGR